MDWFPLGQPVRLATTVTDLDGVPTDPTTLTLTVTAAGGTPVVLHWPTPDELTRTGTGVFHYDYTPPAAGHYVTYWTASGTAAGVSPYSTVLDVFDPATTPRLVSTADAAEFIRRGGQAITADRMPLLDRMVGWASARILAEVAAVRFTAVDTVTARGGRLTLPRCPVREVTAIVPLDAFAPAVAASDLIVTNPLYGLVRSATGTWLCGTYQVTYAAGPDEITPGVDGACLQLIQHWFNQSQAHGSSTYGDGGFVPDFDDLPNSVRNKLRAAPTAVLMA